MKVVRNLLISSIEPTDTNIGWIKPLPNGSFELLFFGSSGWVPVSGEISGKIKFQYIEDIPDIIINTQ